MSEEEIGVGVGFMPESVTTTATHGQMGWPDTCGVGFMPESVSTRASHRQMGWPDTCSTGLVPRKSPPDELAGHVRLAGRLAALFASLIGVVVMLRQEGQLWTLIHRVRRT